MLGVIRVEGAPVDQGRAQGEAMRTVIRQRLARARAGRSVLDRAWERKRARRTTAIELTRHLPGQRERIEGLALGARVDEADLVWLEATLRTRGVAISSDGGIAAAIDVAPDLASLLLLRRSLPDAGGFPSVELTLAPVAGSLAGVNAEGLAALCIEDGSLREPSLRFLVSEIVFRSCELDPAIEHLRRRAQHLGGTGRIVVADAKGRTAWLRLRAGVLEREEPSAVRMDPAHLAIRIDPARRRLAFRDVSAVEHEACASG